MFSLYSSFGCYPSIYVTPRLKNVTDEGMKQLLDGLEKEEVRGSEAILTL